jgi:hypothetical protein
MALVGERNPTGLLAGVDEATRNRLSQEIRDHGGATTAGLLMFDVLGHSSRDDVLAWQRPLEVAFALGVLDSSEQAVLDRIQWAVDFIDDREWCRRLGDRLGIQLEFNNEGFAAGFDRVIRVEGIKDLIDDPRAPQIMLSALEYRSSDTLVLQAKDRSDLISLQQGETAWVNRNGAFTESAAPVWLPQLKELASRGFGFDRLSWKGGARLA